MMNNMFLVANITAGYIWKEGHESRSSLNVALIVFGAPESSKSSSVNFLHRHLEAGGSSVSWPSSIGRSWRRRLTWDRSGRAPNFLAPRQMAARHDQMGPQRSPAPALLPEDGDERAAGVKETGSNSSHLLISRK